MHRDQLTVTTRIVQELVAAQFPQWRDLPVQALASIGTVNAIFRLGEELTARFPLQPSDVDDARRELAAEADAARELAGRTRFRTPEPVALGEPGRGYPMPWSVQTWLPGLTASEADVGASVAFAQDLAEFIGGVRAIPTEGRRFSGRGRGGDLSAHDAWLEECLERSVGLLDVAVLRAMWRRMRELPRTAPDVMCHKDLMPGNLLVVGGRLAGVIDVGGLGPADPALDLVVAWHVLEDVPRRAFREVLDCDDVEWERGRAWAFEQAIGLVWYYRESNPAMSRLGRTTLNRLMAGGEASAN